MYYTANICNPEEGIEMLIEAASKFNADRFLYAIKYKDWDDEKLKAKCEEVAFYKKKLEVEFQHLVQFAEVFNKEFTTMNNNCYSSALILLRKLKSGISETKKLFKGFCPRARRESVYHAIGNNPVSAFNYSNLCAKIYQLDLFEFEGYPPYVETLYNEMEQFLLLLVRCIQVCKQVLEDEKVIRSDSQYCLRLFEKFKKEVLDKHGNLFEVVDRHSKRLSPEGNPAIASRLKYGSNEIWSSVGFHAFLVIDTILLAIMQLLDEAAASDITQTELLLFGNDVQKVHTLRLIIRRFDELIPDSHHRQHLPAKYVQMFIRYAGIPKGREKAAVGYFNEAYLSSDSHKFFTVTYSSVNACKKDVQEDLDGSYEEFENEIGERFGTL